ncbi:MAG: hypothetical protein U0T36_08725 [Saprospiraceae bacterium]
MVDALYKKGYRNFGLDEVHKYPNWSIEIKNIYDNYTDVYMIVTSIICTKYHSWPRRLKQEDGSIRCEGMSFSEFMTFEYKRKHSYLLRVKNCSKAMTEHDTY